MSVDAKIQAIRALVIGKIIDFHLKGVDPQAPKGEPGEVPRAFVDFKSEEPDGSLSTIGHTVYSAKLRIGFRTGSDTPGNSYEMSEALKEAVLTFGLDPFVVKDVRIRAPAGRELWYGLELTVSG
jgi:hypothetical protein